MTSFLPQYYELLKHAVITTSGLNNITPHDCRIIAAEIFRKTKNSVSETTLKRVFGFAYSKFKPSIFTIDVLARYCGYKGWEDFCLSQETKLNKTIAKTAPNWDNLKLNAQKITNLTLQVLRNKSVIPYSQTISRQTVTDHLDDFLTGDYNATVLASPAGYGKTLALCHWLEERLLNNDENNNQDVVLFFSTSALMNAFLSGQDIHYWLLALLGYTANDDVPSILNQYQERGGKFYLIIDAFDEHVYKPEQYNLLLAQLVDILALYRFSSWFKLILTMRSFTWINKKHQFNITEEKWFIRFIGDANSAINVPVFDAAEIRQLALNINQNENYNTSADISLQFSHPLYFQFYYKQNPGNFTLSNISKASTYEMVAAFKLNKVYTGQNAADKIQLIQGLTEEMDIANGNFTVLRAKVNSLVKHYSQAYHDLLSVGYLIETNKSTGLHYNVYIEFINLHFRNNALAELLLYKNDFVFNEFLIEDINRLFETNGQKVAVLQWCVMYAFKAGQQYNFNLLTHARLSPTEKADLINFMGDMFTEQNATPNQNELLSSFFQHDCSPELFNYFFGAEFVSIKYKRTLQSLLKFNLSDRKRAFLYTALALIATLRLDLSELENCVSKLRSLPYESFSRFAINPIKCLDAIYSYLKNGEIKREVAHDLTKFYFNPPKEGNYFTDTASHDMLFLLGAYTLILFQKPLKTLRYINALEKNYKLPKLCAQHGYGYFMEMIKADSYYKLARKEQFALTYQHYHMLYRQSPENFTDYMKTVFYALRIKVDLNQKDYSRLIQNTKAFMEIAGQHTLSILLTLSIIVNNNELINFYPEFYKNCRYGLAKILREHGLAKQTFSPAIVSCN
ncbi:hypothetical protein CKK33_02190 [Mucilaginibacter sp. MD40]|uniref:hypothetical protein n=1 Tax=Mucilaginibacter sp. MD40 TaxID=2029590 RepID=UPI000BACE2B6|nr:hypothetical protein [Mucilaginibacter sp. MD40]PAW92364.1 hypothetical protein CKK33_02190 [Mucilaginibacter sp. MD40]